MEKYGLRCPGVEVKVGFHGASRLADLVAWTQGRPVTAEPFKEAVDLLAMLVALAMVLDLAALVHLGHRVPVTLGGVSLAGVLAIGIMSAIAKELLAKNGLHRVFSLVPSILLVGSVLWISLFWDWIFSLSLWVLIASFGQREWPRSWQVGPVALWVLHAAMQWLVFPLPDAVTRPAVIAVWTFLVGTGLGGTVWFYVTRWPPGIAPAVDH